MAVHKVHPDPPGRRFEPWDNNNWTFFGETSSRADAIDKIHGFLNPRGPEKRLSLIGPYKIGKTSTYNFALFRWRGSDRFITIPLDNGTESDVSRSLEPVVRLIIRWFAKYATRMEQQERKPRDKRLWRSLRQLAIYRYGQREGDPPTATNIRQILDELMFEHEFIRRKVNLVRRGQEDTNYPKILNDAWTTFGGFLSISDGLGSLEESIRFARQGFPQNASKELCEWWTKSLNPELSHSNYIPVFYQMEDSLTDRYIEDMLDYLGSYVRIQRDALSQKAGLKVKRVLEKSQEYGRDEFRQRTLEEQSARAWGPTGSATQTEELIQFLSAFTTPDANALVLGNSTDKTRTDPIQELVGRHPLLLQLARWELLENGCPDPKACTECLDECANEMESHVRALLSNAEQWAILHKTYKGDQDLSKT